VLAVLRNAKAAGVVVDWQQIDPAYKKDLTGFIDKFADALHDDNKELWLCVQPGRSWITSTSMRSVTTSIVS
jgi:spore germination protein YaaH